MKSILLVSACLLASASYAQLSLQHFEISHIGITGSGGECFTEFKGKTLFFADDVNKGNELWVYDAPVFYNISDINPAGSAITGLYMQGISCVLNDKFYFAADDGVNGEELWTYDGSNPPYLVNDMYVGSNGSKPQYMVTTGYKLYFVATTLNRELWCHDPVTNSTLPVTSFNKGKTMELRNLAVFNGKILFSAAPDYTVKEELYEYDPGTGNTKLVADIHTMYGSTPGGFTVYKNKVYFAARSADYGVELYEYDGTNPPVRLSDINAGPDNSISLGGFPYICVLKDAIYFCATANGTSEQLYKYEPATGAIGPVDPLNMYYAGGDMAVYGRKIYFTAQVNQSSPPEMMVYDGSQVYKFSTLGLQSFTQPFSMGVSQGRLFFSGAKAAGDFEPHMFVDSVALSVPVVFEQGTITCAPNPVTTDAHLGFELKGAATVSVRLTDIQGRAVYNSTKRYDAGKHETTVPMRELAAGVYTYTVINGEGVLVGRGKLTKQ